jgi:hypothetical protein
MNNEYMNLNSITAYRHLEEAIKAWSFWQEKVIILDEGKKAMFSKCVLKHKLESKSVVEAEHKARTDKEYTDIVKQYAKAEKELISARYHYNNLDRYISFKQTEIKRDLTLMTKQEG